VTATHVPRHAQAPSRPVAPPPPPARPRKQHGPRWLPGLLLVSPSLILIGIFVYGFLGWNVRVSFTNWRGLSPSYHSVGLDNYVNLFKDDRFRGDIRNLIVFTSLSKRSNAPGLRSGGIAGDASLVQRFLLYRTYHGSAMSITVQQASIAAWRDEAHVRDNRAQYRGKFAAVRPMLEPVLATRAPAASFYLWAGVPGGDDETFARDLFAATHVTVLPGRYLAREAHGVNPGHGFVRIALVPELNDCVEAARRIVEFCR